MKVRLNHQRYIPHYSRYLLTLALLFSIEWIILAVSPQRREVWACENIIVVIGIIVLITTYKRFPLSRISYTCIFIFLCIHEIGAHYTYVAVPYNSWVGALFGIDIDAALGLERNSFDRFAHFAYGFFCVYPLREVFIRIVNVRGFWGYFLPLDIALSSSMVFELFEWMITLIFAEEVNIAYLGAQGDIWDAQKDVLVAALGAILSTLIIVLIDKTLKIDFAREWSESLRVKHREPLGENEILRLWRSRRFGLKRKQGRDEK